MTNKIMQNNSLYNLNNNKILQDKFSTMMSTQKKLTRPSDDPIVAIRALRLRTSVMEISQFNDKNAKDASAWLSVTEDSLATVGDIIGGTSGLTSLMTRAASKEWTPTDINIMMQQILSLRDELYATANVDYAGRYIFTGYRTDTTLSFKDDIALRNISYEITEQFNLARFDVINYTDLKELANINKSNYDEPTFENIAEQQIENVNIHRLQLSYDDVKAATKPTIEFYDATKNPPERLLLSDWVEDWMTTGAGLTDYVMVSTNDSPDPYQTVKDMTANGTVGMVFVPETGELLISDAAYDMLRSNVSATTEIRVTYEKDHWIEGDLRPEHYFACESTEVLKSGETKVIAYNQEYLEGKGNAQIISYDVGYNQRIQINTLAEDVFKHAMDRNVDDLDKAVKELLAIETTLTDMKAIRDSFSEGSPEYIETQKKVDAAQKAYDYIRENVHKMFENSITVMQTALDAISVAVTDSGTRSARLDLISNRLLSQKTTFEVLKSENEDIDIAEVAIKLTSAELSYNAALMATGKISQTSLMNYI
jgi:flagellar hook-associated protein 3 FlgL